MLSCHRSFKDEVDLKDPKKQLNTSPPPTRKKKKKKKANFYVPQSKANNIEKTGKSDKVKNLN